MKKIILILVISSITFSCQLIDDFVKPQKKQIYALVGKPDCAECLDNYLINFTLYKNGIPTPVETTEKDKTYLTSMKIKGNDIYYTGYSGIIDNKTTAKYWKNGNETKLTDGTKVGVATDIDVRGNEVFVSGYESSKKYGITAKYWTNNKVVDLTKLINEYEEGNDEARNVVVTSTDIYIVGVKFIPKIGYSAMYWKNNVAKELPYSSGSVVNADKIIINGSDTHIIGKAKSNIGDNKILKYWKNGNEKDITDGKSNINNCVIAVKDNDVYIAWQDETYKSNIYSNSIKLWKNGITTTITNNWRDNLKSIQIDGADVYLAGSTYDQNNGKYRAAYWKNGELVILDPNSTASTSIAAFIIK